MEFNFDELMMKRCIQLAMNSLGTTYPNPLVGCVLVNDGKIIAEAWHQKAGEAHAEVNAINQIKDKEILKHSTLYVSLEPCAHFGRTPPCSNLIIEYKIPKVVVGTTDPFAKVNGLGIQKMKDNGIEVKVGVLEPECQELNKRFFTFHQKKRPYVILKWAQTADGFMATEDGEQKWITNTYSKQLVHLWRTQEQAILIGTATAKFDNPQLNARLWNGQQPIRIVIDKDLKLNPNLHLFDQNQRTLVITEQIVDNKHNLEYVQLKFDEYFLESLMAKLYELEIQSIIIEGGKKTLDSFILKNLWDEARILSSIQSWQTGVKSPDLNGKLIDSKLIGADSVKIYKNEFFL